MKTTSRTYSLPNELVKKIQEEAKKTERNESQMVRLILNKYYEDKGEKI